MPDESVRNFDNSSFLDFCSKGSNCVRVDIGGNWFMSAYVFSFVQNIARARGYLVAPTPFTPAVFFNPTLQFDLILIGSVSTRSGRNAAPSSLYNAFHLHYRGC